MARLGQGPDFLPGAGRRSSEDLACSRSPGAAGPCFARWVGIDYSGAGKPSDGLPGIAVVEVSASGAPRLVDPKGQKRWSRTSLTDWILEQLRGDAPMVLGIDHGFGFPAAYFAEHGVQSQWDAFLQDFVAHWPAHIHPVESLRRGNPRAGNSRWRRLCERRARGAKSVFHFDVQGSVAKSTHAGLAELWKLRQSLEGRVHVWPFDGWRAPRGKHVLAEVYPRLFRSELDELPSRLSEHERDAFVVAAGLARLDQAGALTACFEPRLTQAERALAEVEGWILGLDPG